MAIRIEQVDAGSEAEALGLAPGDELLSVDGNELNDTLDYDFYTDSSSFHLKAKVAENGYKFALLLVTDIFNEGSKFICEGDVAPVSEAFGIDATKAEWVDGILSRKKQVIPPLS